MSIKKQSKRAASRSAAQKLAKAKETLVPSIPANIRPEFIVAMSDELVANRRKGDFNTFLPTESYVPIWVLEHVMKLLIALRNRDFAGVTEYSADIANIVMKVEQVYGLSAISPKI